MKKLKRNVPVASQPTPSQGLSLDEKGSIPSELLRYPDRVYVGTIGRDGVDAFLKTNPFPYQNGSSPGPVPFDNSWTNAGDPYEAVWFGRATNGDIIGGGVPTGGTPGTSVYTLPSAFGRPSERIPFASFDPGNNSVGGGYVDTDGKVYISDVASFSNVTLGDTGVTAGTYGDSSHVGQFTVGSDGRLTAASSVSITASAGVSSFAKQGSTALTGAVTISGGSGVSLTESGQNVAIALTGTPGVGLVVKLFDSTLGADAASIDTGAGGIDTSYDFLEVYIISRTADAGAGGTIKMLLNNDTTASYDRQNVQGASSTASATATVGATSISIDTHGSGGRANVPGVASVIIPNYAGTTFEKSMLITSGRPDSTVANEALVLTTWNWRNTSAISQLSIATSSGSNLKTGTRILIYGR